MDGLVRIDKGIQEGMPRPTTPLTRSAAVQPHSYRCPICHDALFIHPRREDGAIDPTRVVRCPCQKEEDLKRHRDWLLRFCELPAGSSGLTFETWRQYRPITEAYRLARSIADETGGILWLTIIGETDMGKTHLAVAICHKWLSRGRPAKFVYVPDLLDWLREAFRQGAGSDQPDFNSRMEILKTAPLLVLDDLGAEKPSEWARERLDIIINHRYINHLPLVVTTNKPVDKLPGDDEGRIGSRLRRFTPGKVIALEGIAFSSRKTKGE